MHKTNVLVKNTGGMATLGDLSSPDFARGLIENATRPMDGGFRFDTIPDYLDDPFHHVYVKELRDQIVLIDKLPENAEVTKIGEFDFWNEVEWFCQHEMSCFDTVYDFRLTDWEFPLPFLLKEPSKGEWYGCISQHYNGARKIIITSDLEVYAMHSGYSFWKRDLVPAA